MSPRKLVRLGILGVLFAACSALPAMAQGVGSIGGTVVDPSSAVLPGVTVTLSNTQGATIGSNQTAISNERGDYEFLRLVPGTYIVKAELQGFRPAEARGVVVNSDQRSRADLKLEIGALAEGVTVSGEAPLLDTTTALRQTVLSRDVLEQLPNREDVWAVAKVVPSITLSKVDVGGSEGFLQSTATVHGSSGENKYNIDGMDDSSLDGNATIATMYMDPFAFQETNFMLTAGSAEQMNGGLTFNMVTRTGTNQFHGGAMYDGTGPSLSSNNFSPALRTQLLSAVPAKVLAADPTISPNAQLLKQYDAGVWIAGPVIKDKLWYSFTYHAQRYNANLLGSYDDNGLPVVNDNWMWTTTEKAAYQLTKSAQLSYFNNLQYKLIGHRSGGTFGDSAARQYSYKYPDVHQVKFTSPFGKKIVVDASYNRMRADDCFCKRPEVPVGAIATSDSISLFQNIALATYNANAMFRDQVRVSASLFTGKHDIHFGYEGMKGGEKSRVWSLSGMRANYANGVPISVNTYAVSLSADNSSGGNDVPELFENWSIDQAAYVQDKWSVSRRLVVNLGVRYDTESSYEPASCRPTSVFAGAGACFPEVHAPSFKNPSPRVNAIYDLTGDGKTALKFAVNRYNVPIGISYIARLNPVGTASDTRLWTGCTAAEQPCPLNSEGLQIPLANDLGPSNGYAFTGVTASYAAGLKRPNSNEYSAEVERQLPMAIVLSVGYTDRQTRNGLAEQNTAQPASSYTGPITVTEVNAAAAGYATLGTVQVWNRGAANPTANLFFNSPLADTTYHGVDITLSKRMRNGFSLTGGATYGKTTRASIGATTASDINNPNVTQNPYYLGGITPSDRPWSYRASGVIQLPYQVSVSGTEVVQAGDTYQTTVALNSQTIKINQSTQTINVSALGAARYPVLYQTDFSIRRNFRFHNKSFSPRVDFFNLANNSTLTTQVTQLGSTYLTPTAIQRGRLIKAQLNVEF